MSTEPESLVISSQVSRRGGTAFVEEVLVDNPVLITFSFEVVYDNIDDVVEGGVSMIISCIHVLMRDERREEERSKQGQTNKQGKATCTL